MVIHAQLRKILRITGTQIKKPKASVTNPGVKRKAPANSRQAPSKRAETGNTCCPSDWWASLSVASPCCRKIHAPISAVPMIRITVFQIPISPPRAINTAISIIGKNIKAISIIRVILAILFRRP